MATKERLFLHEEVLLLALGDEQGKIAIGSWYAQAVGGAVLAELLLAGRVRLGPGGKKGRVEPVSSAPLGDELVDEWLAAIASREKRRKLPAWISRVAETRRLKHRAALGLVRRGILRAEERDFWGIFKRKVYPELDPVPEREIRERLREAVSGNGAVDPHTIALLSLAKATELLPLVLSKKELKARKARIKSLVAGELAGEAAGELVAAAQTAILTAAVVPALVS